MDKTRGLFAVNSLQYITFRRKRRHANSIIVMLSLLQPNIIGLRVVRGDDWQWKKQDGGVGFVGTVVEVGGRSGSKNPDKTVVVVWDTGVRAKYRAGYDDKDDLRVLDNAPAGPVSIQQQFNLSQIPSMLLPGGLKTDFNTLSFCNGEKQSCGFHQNVRKLTFYW